MSVNSGFNSSSLILSFFPSLHIKWSLSNSIFSITVAYELMQWDNSRRFFALTFLSKNNPKNKSCLISLWVLPFSLFPCFIILIFHLYFVALSSFHSFIKPYNSSKKPNVNKQPTKIYKFYPW